jgi:rRNA maturation protein Nop10
VRNRCSHLWEDVALKSDDSRYVLHQQCWKCARERILPLPERFLPARAVADGGER